MYQDGKSFRARGTLFFGRFFPQMNVLIKQADWVKLYMCFLIPKIWQFLKHFVICRSKTQAKNLFFSEEECQQELMTELMIGAIKFHFNTQEGSSI